MIVLKPILIIIGAILVTVVIFLAIDKFTEFLIKKIFGIRWQEICRCRISY